MSEVSEAARSGWRVAVVWVGSAEAVLEGASMAAVVWLPAGGIAEKLSKDRPAVQGRPSWSPAVGHKGRPFNAIPSQFRSPLPNQGRWTHKLIIMAEICVQGGDTQARWHSVACPCLENAG